MRRYRIATAIVVLPVGESAAYASKPLAHNRIPGLETFLMDNDDYSSVATPKAFSDSPIQARDSERSSSSTIFSTDAAPTSVAVT
jgi:hypothetical protein